MTFQNGDFPSFMLDLTQWIREGSLEGLYRELELVPWMPGAVLPRGIRPVDGHQGVYLLDRIVDASSDRDVQLAAVRQAAEAAAGYGGMLVVRVTGGTSCLLHDVAEAGADCIEGVSCPPQGDELIMKARGRLRRDTLLWGGLPRDCMLSSWPERTFQQIAKYVAEAACGEYRVIVGVAGGVPSGAEFSRIRYLADLFRHMEDMQ